MCSVFAKIKTCRIDAYNILMGKLEDLCTCLQCYLHINIKFCQAEGKSQDYKVEL